MRVNKTILLDDELLNLLIAKDPGLSLSDFFEGKIAEHLGVKKSWVDKDATSVIVLKRGTQPEKKIRPARAGHNNIKDIWGNVSKLLDQTFTKQEYMKALFDAGYDYAKSSLYVVPTLHINQLLSLNRIVVADEDDKTGLHYKKVLVPVSSSNLELEKTVKSLKDGKKVILGVIS